MFNNFFKFILWKGGELVPLIPPLAAPVVLLYFCLSLEKNLRGRGNERA